MPKYRLDLDDFMDEVFLALEGCSEGVRGHEVIINARDAEHAGETLGEMMADFFTENFEEI
jgi:hypothetical protein